MSSPQPVRRVLIANRGEIARRIIRTCRRLGVATIAVHSDADADAPFVREADVAVHLPGNAAATTYLDTELLLQIAVERGADAIHPGYGFLSERADAARAAATRGLTWIGPPAEAIEAMGSKIEAKRLMRAAGVPVLPDSSVEALDEIGLPALVKASAGGGGRGMRLVHSTAELEGAIASATHEAHAAFGDGAVFVERYVEGGRHVEIQVIADRHGNTVALFERDCTIQRRHQKILEESPSPAVDDALRARMCAAAVAAAQSICYESAGTVELLLDRGGEFFFLEMNTRLQVEHAVTEMRTGLDLVELQLRIAGGERLPDEALRPVATGHAIEVRLCAEDPSNGYRPSTGTFHTVELPEPTGVRVDSGLESGSVVSPFYDSMIAKLIAVAPTRGEAARRLRDALLAARLIGPVTNRGLLIDLLQHIEQPGFDDEVDTGWLDRHPPAPPEPRIAAIAGAALAVGDGRVARRIVLDALPPGWRNNPAVPAVQGIGEHEVSYRFGRDGRLAHVDVDGKELDAAQLDDAERIRHDAVVVGDRVHVERGLYQLIVPPRFVAPDAAGRDGSLVAPMPGVVLRVMVVAGDPVVAEQPMVAMEAMKMEHQVVAPRDGVVEVVHVAVGQQVDSGTPLIDVTGAPR